METSKSNETNDLKNLNIKKVSLKVGKFLPFTLLTSTSICGFI